MNIKNVILAFCSFSFFMIGADKFLAFIEPPCSMMANVSPTIWKTLGVLQFAAGILIWFPKVRKYVAGFFSIFMIGFTIYHLLESTYDIGGAAFMAVLLGLLVWNPSFLSGRNK